MHYALEAGRFTLVIMSDEPILLPALFLVEAGFGGRFPRVADGSSPFWPRVEALMSVVGRVS